MNTSDMAIEILRLTRDGDALAPEHLYLLECAVNDRLSDAGKVAFTELYAHATKSDGYTRPWFHGIEHLTKDHEGYVYWKGIRVEHYSFYGDDAHAREREAALALARACERCEEKGLPVKFSNLDFSR